MIIDILEKKRVDIFFQDQDVLTNFMCPIHSLIVSITSVTLD